MKEKYLEKIGAQRTDAYFNVDIDGSVFGGSKFDLHLTARSVWSSYKRLAVEDAFRKYNSAVNEESWTGGEGETCGSIAARNSNG